MPGAPTVAAKAAVTLAGWLVATDIAGVIAMTGAALLGALMLFFRQIYWTAGVAGESFVPDSARHSILFALSVLGAMAGTHFLLLPTPQARTD